LQKVDQIDYKESA